MRGESKCETPGCGALAQEDSRYCVRCQHERESQADAESDQHERGDA